MQPVYFCVVTANDFGTWSAQLVDTDKQHVPLIRQADINNHNLEGGFWIISGGCVYDITHLRSHFHSQQVEQCIRKCILALYALWSPQRNVPFYLGP